MTLNNEQNKATTRTSGQLTHLIQLGLMTGKREGESERELFLLDAHLFHEICKTISDVVE